MSAPAISAPASCSIESFFLAEHPSRHGVIYTPSERPLAVMADGSLGVQVMSTL